MKHTSNIIPNTWKRSGILIIGGLLLGAGIADCLFALNEVDLNKIARGLTIFSAGLTILVILDNSKTQKQAEQVQLATQLRVTKVEAQLHELLSAQQHTQQQLQEIKELLMHQKANVEQQVNAQQYSKAKQHDTDTQDVKTTPPSE